MEAIQKTTSQLKVNRPRRITLTLRGTRFRDQQSLVLKRLLNSAKNTEFGMINDFKACLDSDNIMTAFSNIVPMTNYDMFYEDWSYRCLNGESDVIWPGTIKNFALSSGTTKASSKYIPVSEQMLRQFKKTSLSQVTELTKSNFSSTLLRSKVLIIGGSTKLNKKETIRIGDLSGILSKNKSWAFTSFSKPGKKISQIKDWDEKMDRIVKKAPKWNIGVIAGVPSWISLLLERIIKEHQIQNIHEIWPNFQLYVHGGVFLDPYKQKIEKMLGRPIGYQNTFLASEGYFGYQKDFNDEYMELLPKHGIYFEFVPAKYFDQLRSKYYYNIETLTIDQIESNTPYCLVVSTCSGLWRYNLGDIISFKEKGSLKFKILGRISYDLNLCGEHLSEDNISKAILLASNELSTEVHEFCTFANNKKKRHEWYIGVDHSVDESTFEVLLDKHLKNLNDDYATARKYVLKRPRIKALPSAKFYEYMSINERYGSQYKFPRVLNVKQVKKWESFLSNINTFMTTDSF
jgi:hypothetical protein